MRARGWIGAAVAAAALFGVGAPADETSAPDEAEIENALDEPVDPDEAVNLEADEDPEDVGQEALEPDAELPEEDSELP